MRQTIKDFRKEIEGQDVYLVGGGPSFKPEEYVPLIPQSRTICLNSSLEDFEKCLAVMWMDSSWYGSNRKLIREQRHKYAINFNVSLQFLDSENRDYMSIRNVSCSQCDYNVKREKYNVCGNNVGCTAIDLLDQMNARTIYLLGFDCDEKDGKSHYHDRYNRRVKGRIYQTNFVPCFVKLSKHIKNSNVINLSEESKIPCFKKAKPESVLGPLE